MNRPLFQLGVLPLWPLCASVARSGSIPGLRRHSRSKEEGLSWTDVAEEEEGVKGAYGGSCMCLHGVLHSVVGCYGNLCVSCCLFRYGYIHCSDISD